MLLKNYKINGYITRFILLINAVIHAIPVGQQGYEQPLLDSNLNEDVFLNGLPIPTEDSLENQSTEHIIERPCNVWGMFKELGNSSDFKVYREVHEDGQFKRLCWAELLIITEDNITRDKKLSREYSIILENPGDVLEEHEINDRNTEQYKIWDEITKESKLLNFTTIRRTKDFTTKEHKILFCGTGPILTKLYFEWPKLNKKRIEIRLSPTTTTTWKLYDQDRNFTETRCTQPASYNTFDTTKTNEYPMFTTTEITTENLLKNTYDPLLLHKNENKENTFKINSDKSTSFLYESGERFDSKNTDVNTNKAFNIENNTIYYDGASKELTTKHFSDDNDFLKQNTKDNVDERTSINTSKNSELYDNFRKDSFLLDLLFPKKVLFSLPSGEKSNHKIISKLKIQLEHRTIDNVTNNEKTDSVVEVEQDSVYHIKLKQF